MEIVVTNADIIETFKSDRDLYEEATEALFEYVTSLLDDHTEIELLHIDKRTKRCRKLG